MVAFREPTNDEMWDVITVKTVYINSWLSGKTFIDSLRTVEINFCGRRPNNLAAIVQHNARNVAWLRIGDQWSKLEIFLHLL